MDSMMTMSKSGTKEFAHNNGMVIKKLAFENDSLFAIYSDIDTSKENLIFVHGAPSSWDAYKSYLSDSLLKANYNLISYDRPGYGQSSKIFSYPKIDLQAKAIQVLMDSLRIKKASLITHSYGGPIGTLFAGEHPERTSSLILFSPVIAPKHEKMFWFSYLAIWPWTRWVLPHSLKAAGSEKKFHAQELMACDDKFKLVKCPVLHMHSLDDFLAPGKANIDYIRNTIDNKVLKIETFIDLGHLFIFFKDKMVKAAILDFLHKNKNT